MGKKLSGVGAYFSKKVQRRRQRVVRVLRFVAAGCRKLLDHFGKPDT